MPATQCRVGLTGFPSGPAPGREVLTAAHAGSVHPHWYQSTSRTVTLHSVLGPAAVSTVVKDQRSKTASMLRASCSSSSFPDLRGGSCPFTRPPWNSKSPHDSQKYYAQWKTPDIKGHHPLYSPTHKKYPAQVNSETEAGQWLLG